MKKSKVYDAAWKLSNRARNREYLALVKSTHKCTLCGEGRSCCLVFHHRDPSRKLFVLSASRDVAFKKIVTEVAKCEILCANCHLALHDKEKLVTIQEASIRNDEDQIQLSLFGGH